MTIGALQAKQVDYTPAAPSDWAVVPDRVDEALDELAATTYWAQPGGVGTVLLPVDLTAPFQVGDGVASAQITTAGGNVRLGTLGTIAAGVGVAATGLGAFATGLSTNAAASAAGVGGAYSYAPRVSQKAHASGCFLASGDAQSDELSLRGQISGSGSVVLGYDAAIGAVASNLAIPLGIHADGVGSTSYNLEIRAVALDSADKISASFTQNVLVDLNSGVVTVTPGVQEVLGAGLADGWGLVCAASGTSITITFNTGPTPRSVRVSCTCRFTEVTF